MKQVFAVVALVAELGNRAVLVDGFLSNKVKAEAIASGDPIIYLNRRCHDKKLKTRRLLVLDTTSSDKTVNALHSKERMHFHGVFEKPKGMTVKAFEILLGEVCGLAETMGERQFHVKPPNYKKGYSHNSVHGDGPIGKLFYALRHAGTTYNDLGFNGDRNRRSGPKERTTCNAKASGLAEGKASNFTKDIVLCDNGSKRAGQAAFQLWLADEIRIHALPAKKSKSQPITARITPVPRKTAGKKVSKSREISHKILILKGNLAMKGEFETGSNSPGKVAFDGDTEPSGAK